MKKLEIHEMQEIQGGGWCGTLWGVAAISCMSPLVGWGVCAFGIVSYAAAC